MIHHVLTYIGRGFAVVPLIPGTKRPSKDKIYEEPIDTEAKAREWWTGSHKDDGIGIFLGKSGLVCVDLDSNHGATEEDFKRFDRTVTVKTRNGYHFYYLAPKIEIASKAIIPPLPGKSDGQAVAYLRTGNHYVVAPPTVVWLDKGIELPEWEYQFHGDLGGPLSFYQLKHAAPCPISFLAPQELDKEFPDDRGKIYLPGARHDMLMDTAVAMARKGKGYEQIIKSLHDRNQYHCKIPKTKAEGVDREIEGIAKWATSGKVQVVVGPTKNADGANGIIAKADNGTVETQQVAADNRSTNQESPIVDGEVERSFPDVRENGTKLGTIANIQELLRRENITARYNVISKQEELSIPDRAYSLDNKSNASLAWIRSRCAYHGIPAQNLAAFITEISDQNQYNPVAAWIDGVPWDGESRLQAFCDTIISPDKVLKEILIKRWLISAIAAIYEPNGVSAHGVLVLQGPQYIGKTQWFKSLVPAELDVTADGMTLRPDDKDSVFQVISKWIVELGELDATFSRADISQLKAFITKNQDVIRRPYSIKESNYARRTVFFGSVNEKAFLNDPTGNRRFWTIPCDSINYNHGINMQQVWAEMRGYYEADEDWCLNLDEMNMLNRNNEKFESSDPIEERLSDEYDWFSKRDHWMNATAVCKELGLTHVSKKETNAVARVLSKLGVVRRPEDKRFQMPLLKNHTISN